MAKSQQTRAGKLFSASERRDQQFLSDKAKATRARTDHMAKLRALRLAKEAADAEAAEQKKAATAERKAAAADKPAKG